MFSFHSYQNMCAVQLNTNGCGCGCRTCVPTSVQTNKISFTRLTSVDFELCIEEELVMDALRFLLLIGDERLVRRSQPVLANSALCQFCHLSPSFSPVCVVEFTTSIADTGKRGGERGLLIHWSHSFRYLLFPHEMVYDVNGQRENNGRILFSWDGPQRLEVSELQHKEDRRR